MVSAAYMAGNFAASAIVKSIRTLYNVAGDMNSWMDMHINEMQSSENQTIAKTGKVLAGVKTGFGFGYVTSVTVIAVGQFLLGNTMAAVGTVASAATLTNPFAMTCAAVGAIIYGWNALSKEDQSDVLDKISLGLNSGIEFIKSVINLLISTSKDVLESKNLAELKDFVRNAARIFGKTLGQITGSIRDKAIDMKDTFKNEGEKVINGGVIIINSATERVIKALDQDGDGQLNLDDIKVLTKKMRPNARSKKQ